MTDVSALAGAIYDCALNPSQWQQTLRIIVQHFSCEKAILSLKDLRTDRILVKESTGWEPIWLEERDKHLPEIHGRVRSWLLQQPDLDKPYVASRAVPPAELEGSAYLQRCLRPQAIVDIAHFFLISTQTHFSELVLFWQEQHGVMTEREMELGAQLLPHLRRAVTISNVLGLRTIECAWMTEVLDELTQGVVLADERGTILYTNRAAEHMLHNGRPINAGGGILRARSRAGSNELAKALALAAQDGRGIGKTGTAICLSEADMPPVFAHVLPMRGGQLRAEIQPRAVAAVFIDAAPDGPSGARAVATAFGLTEAEARVLANLVSGRPLSETAAVLGIARTTARTHLTHIFQKTGVSRQADLIRLAVQAVRFGVARRN